MRIRSTSKLFGWLFKIINKTPFDGELILKFELMPNRAYQINGMDSYLNQLYFSILDYKFVSRIIWNGEYMQERIDLIKNQGMMQFGYAMFGPKSGQVIARKMNIDVSEIKRVNAFPNYHAGVFNMQENYVGEIRFAYGMVSRGYKADLKYSGLFYHPEKKFYFAHTGTIAESFSIEDKVFNEDWAPDETNINWEWIVRYCKSKHIAVPGSVYEFEGMADFKELIPFISYNKRGSAQITNLKEAKLSAKNFLSYMKTLELLGKR